MPPGGMGMVGPVGEPAGRAVVPAGMFDGGTGAGVCVGGGDV